MTALWVQEVADWFWDQAGGASPEFPRNLRPAVAFALPLAVVELPRLRVASVAAWFARTGRPLGLGMPDRALRACLVVQGGARVVFLDATDPPDEQRFSLAHEVAHFLVDYSLPRERVRRHVGPQALPVFDGHRAASRVERVDAALAGVRLAFNLHLMERTPDGHLPGVDVSEAERRADLLALELLAPVAAVRQHLSGAPTSRQAAAAMLVGTFGLPPAAAHTYAGHLAPDHADALDRHLLRRLGLA